MKATTHTEIYRKYEGTPDRRPAVERILGFSGLRQSFRRKLPALLLFTPPAIAALIGCVRVHLKFTVETMREEMEGLPPVAGAAGAEVAGLLGSVAQNINEFFQFNQFLALLTLTWYGSALIAEDRRLSANLLYFARPVTPLRYLMGKMLTTFAIGALTLLVPAMMICWQAAFSSPDWSFLKEKGWIIWRVFAYSAMWILVMSTIILAISSCFKRKGLALMTVFAFVFLVRGFTEVMIQITGNRDYGLFSISMNLQETSNWLFFEKEEATGGLIGVAKAVIDAASGVPQPPQWNIEGSFMALGIMTLVAGAVLWRNVRRMEVIA